MNEIWKSVTNYEGLYEVSTLGRVKRLAGKSPRYRGERIKPDVYTRSEVILKSYKNKKGYEYIDLYKFDGYKRIRKNYFVHRLILMTFNPNENYESLQVNHINGNKEDNNAHNLEWVTNSDNMKHAYSTGLNNRVKQVLSLDKQTFQIIKKYRSIADASKDTGEPEHRISLSANGKKHKTTQYIWAFYDDKEYRYTIDGMTFIEEF